MHNMYVSFARDATWNMHFPCLLRLLKTKQSISKCKVTYCVFDIILVVGRLCVNIFLVFH